MADRGVRLRKEWHLPLISWDSFRVLSARLRFYVMNPVGAVSGLNPALMVICLYAAFVGAGFMIWVFVSVFDAAAGTNACEIVFQVTFKHDRFVLPAMQFLNGLFALYVAFSIFAQSICATRHWSRLKIRRLIRRLPKAKYSSLRATERNDCVICWSCIEDEDSVRILPECKHYFHVSCIDRWLLCGNTCPMCRATVYSNS
eukprot:Gb_15903 [translate_table: standard]